MKKATICICCLSACTVSAQNNDLIRKLKAANRKPDMAYDYKITLYDVRHKKQLDSVSGHLAVKNGAYLDSNGYTYTARVGDYFCRLDHAKKTATVCNMKVLAKKRGVRLENNEARFMHHISDSLLAREGSITIDSSDALLYRLRIRMKNHTLSYAQMDFWRAGYKLAAAHFETVQQNEAEHRITTLTIRNVKHQLNPGSFNLGRIYSLSNGKPVMAPKYLHYNLIPVH